MTTRKYFGRALSRLAIALGLAFGADGVATARTASPDQLARADTRLAAIGYRLAAANGGRCDAPMMITGLSLHDLASYDRRDRPLLQARGLGRGFAIQAEVAGSAAARAGLLAGDEIVAINGRDVTGLGLALMKSRASYARVELFVSTLDAALRAAPAMLTIQRGAARIGVVLVGDRGCGGEFTVQPGASVNAWTDGRYVAVTIRVMDLAAIDDELAFVVAHEMAHNILHHRSEGRHSTLFPKLGRGVNGIKQAEIDADQLAVRLIAEAGFDTGAPERFLRRVAPSRWADLSITHPTIGRRIQLVNAVRDDLDRSRIEAALVRSGYLPGGRHDVSRTLMASDMKPLPDAPLQSLARSSDPMSLALTVPRITDSLPRVSDAASINVVAAVSGGGRANLAPASGIDGRGMLTAASHPARPADRSCP